MRRLSMVIAGIVVLLASSSLATERSELEKATIKAASDCVAAAALNNRNLTKLYQENRLKEITDWIVLNSNACEHQLTAMRLLHDKLYGAGTGRAFVLGDYLADLPRAVDERIRSKVARRIAEEKSVRRDQSSPPVRPDSDGPGKPSSGNEWVADCNSSDLGKLTGCMSYARGIADGLRTWEFLYPNAPVCIPQAVITSQLVDVGRNYIRNNPGARQEGAGWLLALAFKETWPCQKGGA
jgi:hypothetical protein